MIARLYYNGDNYAEIKSESDFSWTIKAKAQSINRVELYGKLPFEHFRLLRSQISEAKIIRYFGMTGRVMREYKIAELIEYINKEGGTNETL